MQFSVPLNQLTERARSSDDHAWDDAVRWFKSSAHFLKHLVFSSSHNALPSAMQAALTDAAPRMQRLTDAQLLSVAGELRNAFRRAQSLGLEHDATTGHALALAAAAMARTTGLTPYATQYRAATLILQGRLAEMATGEGKTVAAALAAAVAALGPQRVHVFTANDYLVQRDSDGLRPFCAALGLSVGHVLTSSTPDERAAAYRCHITVVTAKELAFDYLKDHLIKRGETAPSVLRALALQGGAQAFAMATMQPAPLLPALSMAILDEADSILLDEASMPLILAQPGTPCDAPGYQRAFDITARLQRGRDYAAFPAARAMRLTDAGRSQVNAAVQGVGGVLSPPQHERSVLHPPQHEQSVLHPPQRAFELVEAALTARWMYRRDRDYVVSVVSAESTSGDKPAVQLIDQVTGRIADGRQWTGALQQMVELKEGVPLSAPAVTLAQITFQRFFPRYLRMGGMSGSLMEARHELRMRYDMAVLRVPLLRPSQRRWQGERLFVNAKARWAAVVAETRQISSDGRPVLVGTDSVKDSAHLSNLLTAAGVPHQVLNALQNADEADCIARAGRAGVVTVATNMAGRGTDIQLEAAAEAAGGLHVMACMRNRARRTDRQLRGRGARHGDPGSSQVMVALDDHLLASLTPAWMRRALVTTARDGCVAPWLASAVLNLAQRLAEAQESAHRRRLCQQDRQLGDLCGFAGLTE